MGQESLSPFLKPLKWSCWGWVCLDFSRVSPQLKPSGWALCCARGEHLGGAGWAQPPFSWDSGWPCQFPVTLWSLSQSPEWRDGVFFQIPGCAKLLQHKKQERTLMQMLQGHHGKKTPRGRNSNCYLLTSITYFNYIHWTDFNCNNRLYGEVWPTCDTYINTYMYIFIHYHGDKF